MDDRSTRIMQALQAANTPMDRIGISAATDLEPQVVSRKLHDLRRDGYIVKAGTVPVPKERRVRGGKTEISVWAVAGHMPDERADITPCGAQADETAPVAMAVSWPGDGDATLDNEISADPVLKELYGRQRQRWPEVDARRLRALAEHLADIPGGYSETVAWLGELADDLEALA